MCVCVFNGQQGGGGGGGIGRGWVIIKSQSPLIAPKDF